MQALAHNSAPNNARARMRCTLIMGPCRWPADDQVMRCR
jgi:hypothetical protein